MDIFLSHDWPCGIEQHGDVARLLRLKRHFRDDVANGRLGSPPNMKLLQALKPSYWFSAHLHCKFAAVVNHEEGAQTRFLSLDKCLPERHYLQLVQFPEAEGPKLFSYDEEWLAILKRQSRHGSVFFGEKYGVPGGNSLTPPPPASRPSTEEIEEIFRLFENGDLTIPQNFEVTAPPHDPLRAEGLNGIMPRGILDNPQTATFMDRLGIGNRPREVNPEAIDVDLSTSETDGDE